MVYCKTALTPVHYDGLVQDCSNSSALSVCISNYKIIFLVKWRNISMSTLTIMYHNFVLLNIWEYRQVICHPYFPLSLKCINTLRLRQNGRHFADDVFKCIFLNENVIILLKISLQFVPKGPINNIPSLVQVMAWHRPGGKPLPEPMMVSLLTHICVARPQWVIEPWDGFLLCLQLYVKET